MSQLVRIPVHISQNQGRKALRGGSIQLSKQQLHAQPNIELALHPLNVKKLEKALKSNKGVRLVLSQQELEGSNIWNWLKGAAKFLKEKVIDTPIYQQVAKPALRQLVNMGVEMAPPGLARDAARKLADEVSARTGAFGLKQGKLPKGMGGASLKPDKKRGKQLLSLDHPAMDPVEMPPPGEGCCHACGSKKLSAGSFRPAGYGMSRRGRR